MSLIRMRTMLKGRTAPPPDQPEKKLEKETVVAPGKMSREEKSKIIRQLIKKGLKNKEIARVHRNSIGTVKRFIRTYQERAKESGKGGND